jgi:hypothetical protein
MNRKTYHEEENWITVVVFLMIVTIVVIIFFNFKSRMDGGGYVAQDGRYVAQVDITPELIAQMDPVPPYSPKEPSPPAYDDESRIIVR